MKKATKKGVQFWDGVYPYCDFIMDKIKKMREQITMYRDMYEFYKDTKSKKLLVAFIEYLFEWIEPTDLKWIEKTIFFSLKIRMENQRKNAEKWARWWKNSHWGGRPRNASSELKEKTSKKQAEKQANKQAENKEDNNTNVLLLSNISSYEDIYWCYYWANKWIDEKVCDKLLDAKLKQWITLDTIKKCMVLYNCECRIKQDFKYVKKLETWLKEFQPPNDEQLDERLYSVIKSFRDKKKSDDKFWQSSPAKTLWNDLKTTFWDDKVKSLWKQANSINLTFT